jgi:hypothetical protein
LTPDLDGTTTVVRGISGPDGTNIVAGQGKRGSRALGGPSKSGLGSIRRQVGISKPVGTCGSSIEEVFELIIPNRFVSRHRGRPAAAIQGTVGRMSEWR